MTLAMPIPMLAESARLESDELSQVRRAREGDAGAFATIYRDHAPRVFALCLRLTADRERASELTQDVFVRAWEGLAGFRAESALGTWLHRIAVNVHLASLRAARRRERRLVLDDDLSDPVQLAAVADQPDIEGSIDLERAIARLPDGARTVFVLHVVEGIPYEEIADATGLAAGTLRAHMHRARRLLMEMMS
jgi:RNA polymerase sigma-70 factor, ECF subfamily